MQTLLSYRGQVCGPFKAITRVRIPAGAFNKDPEFYRFTRTLQLYEEGLGKDTRLIMSTDNPLFKLLEGQTNQTKESPKK